MDRHIDEQETSDLDDRFPGEKSPFEVGLLAFVYAAIAALGVYAFLHYWFASGLYLIAALKPGSWFSPILAAPWELLAVFYKLTGHPVTNAIIRPASMLFSGLIFTLVFTWKMMRAKTLGSRTRIAVIVVVLLGIGTADALVVFRYQEFGRSLARWEAQTTTLAKSMAVEQPEVLAITGPVQHSFIDSRRDAVDIPYSQFTVTVIGEKGMASVNVDIQGPIDEPMLSVSSIGRTR